MIAILYAIAMAVLIFYGANLLWLAFSYAKTERSIPGDVPNPDELEVPDATWPIVTVQLPLYNEQHVAERIIDAVGLLNYPKSRLEVQVLDDSTDSTFDIVANYVEKWQKKGLNIVHIHRVDRTGFKAGALQNGLQIAAGELIAIFDADFMPEADYLQRMVPHFKNPEIGMVQARWGHDNGEESLITKIQAASLDAHFAVEQFVRNRTGCFINFNGTAGIWRAVCIEEAGGWQGDTLTEDLDLSYRAQLKGWQFHFVPEVEVPAELPVDLNSLRAQQFRWTKGAVETSKKILGTFLKSDQPFKVKLEGIMHLTAHIVFPFVLIASALHMPLLVMRNRGEGPGDIYFGVLGLGLFAFAGVFLVQIFAQRSLYPNWVQRMKRFPWFLAGSMGLAINNTRAVWEALIGKKSPFVRTPKYSANKSESKDKTWWKSQYAQVKIPFVVWLEGALALYCFAGVGIAVYFSEWMALPFQLMFAGGFGLMSIYNVMQIMRIRQAI